MSPAISDLHSPLYVESEGHGEGPVLMMLHGGAGTLSDLDDLRQRLSRGRRVISPEQRGHGRSTGSGEISYAAQARDTAALLDELKVGPVDLLGWSDGGMVCLLVARDRPDLVHRLIPISANLGMATTPPPVTQEVVDWLAAATPADFVLPEIRRTLPGANADWPRVAGAILDMWRHGPEIEFADLARISSPVLYVAADADMVPVEHTVAMYRATPHADLAIVPAADHHLVQRRVDEVAGIVGGFLARAPG